MLCEKCGKNEATYFYRENVNGKVRTFRLCGNCAEEMEKADELPKFGSDRFFGDFDAFFDDPFFAAPMKAMNGLLSGFFGDRALGAGNTKEKKEGKVCPGCGSTLRDFATRGAGCPRCFEVFADELAPTVSRAHGKTVHTGRAPAKFRDRVERKRKIEALVEEQREAIKNEDFERAAGIRDELKKLREEDAGTAAPVNVPADSPADVPAETPADAGNESPAEKME